MGLFNVIELSIVCLNIPDEGHKTETLLMKTVFDTFASIGSVLDLVFSLFHFFFLKFQCKHTTHIIYTTMRQVLEMEHPITYCGSS